MAKSKKVPTGDKSEKGASKNQGVSASSSRSEARELVKKAIEQQPFVDSAEEEECHVDASVATPMIPAKVVLTRVEEDPTRKSLNYGPSVFIVGKSCIDVVFKDISNGNVVPFPGDIQFITVTKNRGMVTTMRVGYIPHGDPYKLIYALPDNLTKKSLVVRTEERKGFILKPLRGTGITHYKPERIEMEHGPNCPFANKHLHLVSLAVDKIGVDEIEEDLNTPVSLKEIPKYGSAREFREKVEEMERKSEDFTKAPRSR